MILLLVVFRTREQARTGKSFVVVHCEAGSDLLMLVHWSNAGNLLDQH